MSNRSSGTADAYIDDQCNTVVEARKRKAQERGRERESKKRQIARRTSGGVYLDLSKERNALIG